MKGRGTNLLKNVIKKSFSFNGEISISYINAKGTVSMIIDKGANNYAVIINMSTCHRFISKFFTIELTYNDFSHLIK